MKKLVLSSLVALAFFVMAAPHGQGAVLVGNLDQTFDSFTVGTQVGQAFVMGATPYALGNVALNQQSDQSAGETFALYSRNADGTVGNVLLSNFALSYNSTTDLLTAAASSAYVLQANTGYWAILSSTSTNTLTWSFTASTTYSATGGATLPANDCVYQQDGGAFYYTLAQGPQLFQVSTSVPEPSTWAMLGLGAVGAGVVSLRRVTAQR